MKAIMTIETKMTKKDYSNFYYLAAFRKNPIRTIFMFLFTLAISILSNMDDLSNIGAILKNWAIFSLVIILSLIIKIKFRVTKIYESDRQGIFDSYVKLDFFEDRIKVYTGDKKNFSEINYNNIYRIYESNKYFLVYLNKAQASIIRKEDLDDPSGLKNILKEKCGDKYKKI